MSGPTYKAQRRMQERYSKAMFEQYRMLERHKTLIEVMVRDFSECYRPMLRSGLERAFMAVCWQWAGNPGDEYDDENVIAFPWYERHIATEHPSVKRAAARRAAKS